MSISRQFSIEPSVRGYSVTHPPGKVTLPTEPGWNQLLYTASGAMTVSIINGSFMVPPNRALWLPENVRATVANRAPVAVRSLYFARCLGALPDTARAMNVPRFCRELLLHVVRCCPLDLSDAVHGALLTVLIDELEQLPDAGMWLPRPNDPRAINFLAAARADPGASTARLAASVGSGRRTLERIFSTETHISLGAWRRRAHILDSLELLAAGASVTRTATAAGYTTPSAYVAAFRRELGVSPREFLRDQIERR
jgi:AraC-like DNA-binding protein